MAQAAPVSKTERTTALKDQHTKLDTAINAAKSDKNLDRDQREARVKQLQTQQATVAAHLDRISGPPAAEKQPEAAKPEASSEHRIHVIA